MLLACLLACLLCPPFVRDAPSSMTPPGRRGSRFVSTFRSATCAGFRAVHWGARFRAKSVIATNGIRRRCHELMCASRFNRRVEPAPNCDATHQCGHRCHLVLCFVRMLANPPSFPALAKVDKRQSRQHPTQPGAVPCRRWTPSCTSRRRFVLARQGSRTSADADIAQRHRYPLLRAPCLFYPQSSRNRSLV
jgi:hypothetical protein